MKWFSYDTIFFIFCCPALISFFPFPVFSNLLGVGRGKLGGKWACKARQLDDGIITCVPTVSCPSFFQGLPWSMVGTIGRSDDDDVVPAFRFKGGNPQPSFGVVLS